MRRQTTSTLRGPKDRLVGGNGMPESIGNNRLAVQAQPREMVAGKRPDEDILGTGHIGHLAVKRAADSN